MTQSTSTPPAYDASSISILKGLEAVRKRPGMYVQGGTGVDGYHQLLTEIIDNAIDEGLGVLPTRSTSSCTRTAPPP